ncbi:MAG TPA: ATP-binding protein [Pyrinomonadaceae bacterium]|nr:ATP-binding protein [Pyrinomonadaceae bacterium]
MKSYAPKIEGKNWQNQIVQSINEGICVVNKENFISFANPAAARMLGWEIDDLTRQRYEVLFGLEPDYDQSEDEAIVCPVQFALIEGEATHVNTETFYRRNGTSFLVEYICVPIRENEEIVAAVVTFQDISERLDLEEAVAKARDAALEAARIKASFLANMSHEIRTPLNGIVGITDLLAQTQLTAEQTKYIETLKSSSDLLLGIVNDILDFSKIEAKKLELELIDFDLAKIIAETIQLFEPQAVKKQVQLKSEIEKEIMTAVSGDAGRLRQVLNNLVSNAIKFTKDGKVWVKLKLQTDGLFRFEVTDTGRGIEKENQAKIFEPFMQGDISTTRQFGGTGLGLAISKELVQMMGGEIGLESEVGKGATFWFTAKFDVLELWNAEASLSRDLKIQSKISRSLKKNRPKILVVEDNPINQEVALGKLHQLGIKGDIAQNGLEALKILEKKDYDLILMDCRMPEMDGFEATKHIRQFENDKKHIKIIAMTASVTAEERESCFQSGMDDYLAKPIKFEVLAETLNKHLQYKLPPPKLNVKGDVVQHPFAQFLDVKILQNFVEIESRGEKDFVKEMMQIYLSHAETELEALQKVFEKRDFEAVKNKAHSLKGSSGNIGIHNLFERFKELENEVEKKDLIKIEKVIKLILHEFTELKTKVSHLINAGDLI